MLEKFQLYHDFFHTSSSFLSMIPCAVQYLLLSENPDVNEQLSSILEGELSFCDPDLESVVQHCTQNLPHTIILDTENPIFTATWIFSLRKQFETSEVPIIVIIHDHNTAMKDALSFLSRVTVFHAGEESWETLGIFAEMLVDEYLRDPFYERTPNLQTLEKLSRLWMKQNSALIYYGRLNDAGEWIDGYALTLYRGGLRQANAKEAFQYLLCDPNPSIEILPDTELGDWLSVGELLYTALKPWTKPGFLRIRQWYALSPNGTKSDIAKDLPLSLPTRKLLFGKFETDTCIADRLKLLGIRSVQIEAEIEILIRLGLYQIEPNAAIHQDTSEKTDLPLVPSERWEIFLQRALQDSLSKSLIANPWERFDWTPQQPLKLQFEQTLSQLKVFEHLTDIHSRRNRRKLHDITTQTYQTLVKWQYTWSSFEPLSDAEFSNLFSALSAMRRHHPRGALQFLTNQSHPLLQGLRAWIHCQQNLDNTSLIRKELVNLTCILDSIDSSVVLFETYATVMHMLLEHWSMAQRRSQKLPNSYQKRSLDWGIRTRTVSPNLFVFHMW